MRVEQLCRHAIDCCFVSGITRFHPRSPIATGNYLDSAEKFQSWSDDWHRWRLWSALRHFGTHFAESFRMSKSSWMMDPTRSREMPSCSVVNLAEIRRAFQISSWIWSIISEVVTVLGRPGRGASQVEKSSRSRGGADKSLARPTSPCRRTESIVFLERGFYPCADFQAFSWYRGGKEACQAIRAISTTSRREQSSSFFFLQVKAPKEIHAILTEILGEYAPSYATVKNWVAQFKPGDFSTCLAPRPGRPKTVTTLETIDQIHELILEDRRISVKSIVEQLGISRERTGSIIHEDLDMRKLSSKWVPKCRNAYQKRLRCKSSEQLL